MMLSVDKYFSRRYDRKTYNCLHFARDVWFDLTNVDITDRLQGVLFPDRRVPTRSLLRSFVLLDAPTEPCLVMMHRPRVAPHIGVFVRGKVLHITELGVEFLPRAVASRGFQSVRFYVCR